MISKWSNYTASILANYKKSNVLIFIFSFLCLWGQHWTKLEISWGPEKKRTWLKKKKSKTKEEKYNCRVKCTVLIQKPTYTEDQDRMRTKIFSFSHLSQFILTVVHLLLLDSAGYLKSYYCCLTLEAKDTFCALEQCLFRWPTFREYLLSAGYYFESFSYHLILIAIHEVGLLQSQSLDEKTEAKNS